MEGRYERGRVKGRKESVCCTIYVKVYCIFIDDKLLHASSERGLTLFDPSDGSTSVLISISEWEELENELGPIADVMVSHDRGWAMIVTNKESVRKKGEREGGSDVTYP